MNAVLARKGDHTGLESAFATSDTIHLSLSFTLDRYFHMRSLRFGSLVLSAFSYATLPILSYCLAIFYLRPCTRRLFCAIMASLPAFTTIQNPIPLELHAENLAHVCDQAAAGSVVAARLVARTKNSQQANSRYSIAIQVRRKPTIQNNKSTRILTQKARTPPSSWNAFTPTRSKRPS